MGIKRKIASVLALCLAASMLVTGCGKSKYSTKGVEPISTRSSYVTDEMYTDATAYATPDYTRLAKVMRRAMDGEDINVATIGGSITEGYNATSEQNKWATLFSYWWMERFPDVNVTLNNVGIGGTSSYLGVHRVEKEVLEKDPDVIVIEFSVNDGADAFYKKTYDNLIRKIMAYNDEIAIILLFTTQENGTNAQGNDSLIGYSYALPMISYATCVLNQMSAGNLEWKEISNDTVHPNNEGHAIIGELFYRYLNDVYAQLGDIDETVTPFDYKPVTKEYYLEGQFLTADEIDADELGSFEVKQINGYYPGNWYCDGGEEGIKFTVEARNIGIAFQRMVDKGYGLYDVYIDGQCVRSLNGDFSDGWGSTFDTTEVYTSEAKATHTIEIKKNAESEGDYFAIVGLLIS